jgi:LacI family transcriptional regulator
MADVAREAGVSLMTVSRVVNDKEDVSPATRQRVLAIIKRLGYRPSGIARGLATQRTGTLGLVLPDVANTFFANVARGAEQEAYARGYNVFLCNTNEDPQREVDLLRSLEEKRVDGVVLCSSRLQDAELRSLLNCHQAVVLVNRQIEGDGVCSVLIDDVYGGRLATQHLLQAGHRTIGFLAGPELSQSGRQRREGYRAAFAEAGLRYDPNWVRHCAPMAEGGLDTGRELLAAHPELTAMFCYNDLVAVGVLRASAELGHRVPQDLAVVGYDDIPLASLVSPSLTTCRVPQNDLGKWAVQFLLDQIEGGENRCDRVELRPELVVRESAP